MFFKLKVVYENKIKNANINANKAIASVKANPKIAYLNKSSLIEGFLAKDNNNAAKMKPIPIPAPANPEVDKPAPNFCAACTNISKKLKSK